MMAGEDTSHGEKMMAGEDTSHGEIKMAGEYQPWKEENGW
jgi:hypothetical protein